MRDQEIADRIHAAFDIEPLPGGFERLHAAVIGVAAPSVRRRGLPTWPWGPAIAAVVAVALIAALIAHALTSGVSPAGEHHPPPFALKGVIWSSAYSANDVALQLAPPSSSLQADKSPVLITHDGGRTWIRTPIASGQVGVRWIDSKHIIVTTNEIGPPFAVHSTVDGGLTWRTTTMPVSLQLGTMFFLNPEEGWALCRGFGPCTPNQQDTVVYQTIDGGANWQQISTIPTLQSYAANGVEFTSAGRGFASTWDTDGVARLLVTDDRGRTWRSMSLDLPAATPSLPVASGDCADRACVFLPTMFNDKSGVLVAVDPLRGIFTLSTSDGGDTWTSPKLVPVTLPIGLGAAGWLLAVNSVKWFVVDAIGIVHITLDAGATWQALKTTLPAAGLQLDSWIGGDDQALWGMTTASSGFPLPLVSHDGGNTWSYVKLPNY